MSTAALIIGVIGGLLGAFTGAAGLVVGRVANAQLVVGATWAAFLFSLLGILGAGVASRKARLGGGLLLVAGLGIMGSIGWWALIPGPVMLIASLLAFLSYRRSAPTAGAVES